MNLVKMISTVIDSQKRRIGKFLLYGKGDFRTAYETGPYGIDGNPISNIRAVYAETGKNGETVLIGYINVNQKAAPGELRLFSTNASGTEKMFVWLTANGELQLGGSVDNAVRFAPLKTATDKLIVDLQAELVKIASGIVAGGGTYTPGTLSMNIVPAKITQIQTP